ncbi:hypothetical protein JCM10908_000515 [Rhodotorula pacifica]|uniref:uncharacterized protein n=1 Tax=Rhodotorula pacifica TaxID=1495444 RepID=UPI0031801126
MANRHFFLPPNAYLDLPPHREPQLLPGQEAPHLPPPPSEFTSASEHWANGQPPPLRFLPPNVDGSQATLGTHAQLADRLTRDQLKGLSATEWLRHLQRLVDDVVQIVAERLEAWYRGLPESNRTAKNQAIRDERYRALDDWAGLWTPKVWDQAEKELPSNFHYIAQRITRADVTRARDWYLAKPEAILRNNLENDAQRHARKKQVTANFERELQEANEARTSDGHSRQVSSLGHGAPSGA